MLKNLCLLICVLIGFLPSTNAQITKEFIVADKEGYNLVKLNFSSYKGASLIKSGLSGNPLRVHAHLSKANILPTFTQSISEGVLSTNIDHQNIESENLGKRLSYQLFSGGSEGFDHSWFIDLNKNFLYDLNLDLGIGKATLDLSNLPISNCKIKTVSADVSMDYSSTTLNTVSMDTMMIVINMGTIDANRVNFSNAKNMFFDVSYGTVNLSFAEAIPGGSTVSTMVGAGSVNIDLPSGKSPYIIKVKSTAMCRTSIPKSLKEIGNKIYVSKGYDKDAEDLMTFLIDISV